MKWITAVAFLAVFCWPTEPVMACTCFHRHQITVEDLWENDLIFYGEVLSVSNVRNKDGVSELKAWFRIKRSVLAPFNYDTVSVYTNDGPTSCGLFFSVGEKWLIFAGGHKNFSTSWCGNSKQQKTLADEQEINRQINLLESFQSRDRFVRERSRSMGVEYEVTGTLLNGRPTGAWYKIAKGDTIAWMSFKDGYRYIKEIESNSPNSITETEEVIENEIRMWRYTTSNKDGLVTHLAEQYKGDKLHGKYEFKLRRWSETGNYVDDKQDGEWLEYQNDKLVKKKIYVMGKLISVTSFDANGDVIQK